MTRTELPSGRPDAQRDGPRKANGGPTWRARIPRLRTTRWRRRSDGEGRLDRADRRGARQADPGPQLRLASRSAGETGPEARGGAILLRPVASFPPTVESEISLSSLPSRIGSGHIMVRGFLQE